MNRITRLLVVATLILGMSGAGAAHALDLKNYQPNQCRMRCKTVRTWTGNGYVKQRFCVPRCSPHSPVVYPPAIP